MVDVRRGEEVVTLEWFASLVVASIIDAIVVKSLDCLIELIRDRRTKAREKAPRAPKHLRRP